MTGLWMGTSGRFKLFSILIGALMPYKAYTVSVGGAEVQHLMAQHNHSQPSPN